MFFQFQALTLSFVFLLAFKQYSTKNIYLKLKCGELKYITHRVYKNKVV